MIDEANKPFQLSFSIVYLFSKLAVGLFLLDVYNDGVTSAKFY